MINPLYSIIQPLKSRRNDFLKALAHTFDGAHDQSYYLFIAESLAYLSYQTIEEVLHVVYHINLVLSSTGEEARVAVESGEQTDDVIKTCIAMIYLIQLRNFLKSRYYLSVAQILKCGVASMLQSSVEKPVTINDSIKPCFEIKDGAKNFELFQELDEDFSADEGDDYVAEKAVSKRGNSSYSSSKKKVKVV